MSTIYSPVADLEAKLKDALTVAMVWFAAIWSAFATLQSAYGQTPGGDAGDATPVEERKVSLAAEHLSLAAALADICQQAKVELRLDVEGFDIAQIKTNVPVTVSFKDVPFNSAVLRILSSRDEAYDPQGKELGAFGISEPYSAYPLSQRTQGSTLFISVLGADQVKASRYLPAWLKRTNGGLAAGMDDDHEVTNISVGSWADDEFLGRLKTLPKLRAFEAEVTHNITSNGLALLAELPALENLHLYEIKADGEPDLGGVALRAVSQTKTLRYLAVEDCGVTDEDLKALASMTQLTSLSLSFNQISDAGMVWLAGLTNLTDLNLSNRKEAGVWMRLTDAGIGQLTNLTKLQRVDFGGLDISAVALPFPNLETLNLNGAGVTDAAVGAITAHRHLSRLSLNFTGINDRGLEGIATLTELRSLNLDSGVVTDAGIGFLKGLTNLENLSLRDPLLTDGALKQVAEIKSLANLELSGSGQPGVNTGQIFTLRGMEQLAALPRLRELTLFNWFSADGYFGLRQLKQLRSLSLDFCPVGDDEEAILKNLMPDTVVSAMSGGGGIILSLGQSAPRAALPEVSVFLRGQAVDETTEQPVKNCRLEFGSADTNKPDEIVWGRLPGGPVVEFSATDGGDMSWFRGETFRTGKVCARVIATGYQPCVLTPNPALSTLVAPLRLTNLIVRMRKSFPLRGVVTDFDGRPAPAVAVYLVESNFYMRNGAPNWNVKEGTATTDASGRFGLPGGDGTQERVLATTPDGRWFAAGAIGPGKEGSVALPKPATLVLHYDIPDDQPSADFFINFEAPQADPLWQGIMIGFYPSVANGAQVELTNVTPGAYSLARRKTLAMENGFGPEGMRGGNYIWMGRTNIVLEAGKTLRIDLARPLGQSVSGEVTGLAEAGGDGAWVYAYPAGSTNAPLEMIEHNQPPSDAVTCDQEGKFRTARLEPGDYTVAAFHYKAAANLGPRGQLDLFGSATVTVTTNAAPAPARIELRSVKRTN